MLPVIERSFEFVRAEDAGDAHAFRSGIQEYLVRRGDGSFVAVRVRWDEALVAELAALREEGRDPALPRRLGDRLAEWFGEALDLGALPAASRGGEEVRLRVVSSAAELYALPWELLTLPGSGAHLGAAASVQLSYRWPAAGCAAPAGGQRPEGGRILFAWSRAFGPVGEGPIAGALAAAVRDFARRFTDFFGGRAAGHTFIIGLWQSGLHCLRAGEAPTWPVTEGLAQGTPERPEAALWSARRHPNTIHFLNGRIPAGF